MYKGDGVMSLQLQENLKEPLSSTISTEASFNGDSDKENFNINKTCYHY